MRLTRGRKDVYPRPWLQVFDSGFPEKTITCEGREMRTVATTCGARVLCLSAARAEDAHLTDRLAAPSVRTHVATDECDANTQVRPRRRTDMQIRSSRATPVRFFPRTPNTHAHTRTNAHTDNIYTHAHTHTRTKTVIRNTRPRFCSRSPAKPVRAVDIKMDSLLEEKNKSKRGENNI